MRIDTLETARHRGAVVAGARRDRARQHHPLHAGAAAAGGEDLWGAPGHLPVLPYRYKDCGAGGEARHGQL